MKRILFVFGTRPEAIKLWPLYLQLKFLKTIHCSVCITGQHDAILHQFVSGLEIKVDYNLAVMERGQTPNIVISKSLKGIERILKHDKPDLVLVHGDTSTAVAGALAAFNFQVPVGHVEAGLRTGDMTSPFPEEGNRKLIAQIATYHFAPTENAKENLLRENVSNENIVVTGNTVVDAVLSASSLIDENETKLRELREFFRFIDFNKKIIFVTGHRRESLGSGLEAVCNAIIKITQIDDSVQVVFSVHPNPAVAETVYGLLATGQNITLVEPLDYLQCIYIMRNSRLIMTDSGGIQEEAPSFGVPVLITRKLTERPEAVDTGFAKIVGTEEDLIVESAIDFLNADTKSRPAVSRSPFGDGKASQRIKTFIVDRFAS